MRITPDWLNWPETKTLIFALGHDKLKFVGGCVRDALLGCNVHDVDAATPLLPTQVMERLKQHNIKAIPTGIDHGTVTAVINSKHFEVTTLRRDVSTDGRRATVAFTDDWQQDAARRDFTMNALYCDASGEVTDFFGGVDDARNGVVRFIGDASQRIQEDALRILRFFRFYAHYGKAPIDAEGLRACTHHATMIDALSGERICQEMLKLLISGKAAAIVEVMQQAGVLAPVLGCTVNVEALIMLPALLKEAKEPADAMLALAALLRSAKGDAAQLAQHIHTRWKLSNAQAKQLKLLCTTKLQLTKFEALTKRQIRLLGKDDFIQLMLLYAAEGAEQEAVLAAIALARNWEIPIFPVTGDDLKTHGISEGRQIGEALKKLEAQWEKGGYVASKEELIRLCG